MQPDIHIRLARTRDAAGCAGIYEPIVTTTNASFELEPPGPPEMARRILEVGRDWPWLVATAGGTVVGYAYGCAHRQRPAYRWCAEVSVYVADALHRRGIARALYTRLLEGLTLQGFANAYAGIALPNEASVAFHESMGFERVGVYQSVGYKRGRWTDVEWWARRLRDDSPPGEIRPTQFLRDHHGWE